MSLHSNATGHLARNRLTGRDGQHAIDGGEVG
ncbi:MAG: hypothetical protein JWN99_1746, partial [Ilumatobacteraceae bacterium]|nr:hypothetical protein [Ilumatobacteraceae bacterium]